MYQLVDLTKKKVLIVGASSGIGRATALLISSLGAKVVLVSRNEDKLKSLLGLLDGDGHSYYCMDVSKLDEMEEITKFITQKEGKIDGLVYSAGVDSIRPINFQKPEKVSSVMSVNVLGFIEMVRCMTGKKACNPKMSIVGVSSIASKEGSKGKVSYCASKGAMDSAIRAMANELSDREIRVNSVNPGMIETPLFQEIWEQGDLQKELDRQYLGLGKPEDVANVIAFLLSDAAKLITGTSIMIDGGRTSS